MHVIEGIQSRRTIKRFTGEAVPDEVLTRILDAARWAPNHRMTQPWRFRVVGPRALAALKIAAGAGAAKLETTPTLVVASFVPSALPLHAREDEHAAAVATYLTLLAATAAGVASFWRTPAVLRTEEGRAAVALPPDEQVLGLLYFGYAQVDEAIEPPARDGVDTYVTRLD